MMFETFHANFVLAWLRMQQSFTSREVVQLTGISPRQLQWWDERQIVVPARQGHKRIYSLDDLAEVAILRDLRARGFSLQKIRRVIRFLQKELGKRLVETVVAASEYHLLTDGRHIYLEDSARGVVDLLKNARQPMLSVCLSDTIHRVLDPLGRHDGAKLRRATAAAKRNVAVESSTVKKRNGSVRHLTDRHRKAS